ncbi:ABC transporter permease [Sulfitobacter pseudonitzschiae]|nr:MULTISPECIES: ABC transporter permease [Roseobacteraceae]MBM1833972.1 ABC transporter permease [Pseudosulfitobacter pseudonitzschiae]MBM1838838.1 ABC transporter permease [Pseudosulfitobacter pseudonitzschiae]MBM1848552.1 ABC transporter permease [Pseudosulfitobacter pseudonitzschiae]MBM1867743.1 ABC transporter permease [Pseudosulfitobacter pseudonitzschiae]MBM1872743.1 ABC transporter permease [Pseudosulfitobacter pseudonitzschiae]
MADIPALRALPSIGRFRGAVNAGIGMASLLFLWWLGGRAVANDPDMFAFADFAPAPTLSRLWVMLTSSEVIDMAVPSLYRVGAGMALAAVIGIPMGILIGRVTQLREITNIPFQFLRMISPLSWMPIAVMAFDTWDGAIVFLIAVASIWPILFATAAGVRRIDPEWIKVARNLGANPRHMLTTVILPAIAVDILTGVRLALGVAWVVLVPAEYLGVTSGLGYAINDARDTLEYDRLSATVVVIGVIGFALDTLCQKAITRLNWMKST